MEREAAEAERKRKEEEEARERAAREAAEREAALARIREEKAMSLGAEPEKGPNVTQVMCFIFSTYFHYQMMDILYYHHQCYPFVYSLNSYITLGMLILSYCSFPTSHLSLLSIFPDEDRT